MSRIAVLGMGAMGSRVAQNLLNANHQVAVYNRTADKVKSLVNGGAIYAATPREAAEQADIVISMVSDNEVSRKVWLDPEIGAAKGLGKDAIACLGELPVISPAAKNAANLMLANNYAPMFSVELVEKDFRYVIETAQAVNAVTPASIAIRNIYQDAIANGYGSDNLTGVIRLFV